MLSNKLRKQACGFVSNTPIWSTEHVSLLMPNKPLCSTPEQHLPVEFSSLLFASACTWHTCESRSPVKCYADSRRHQDARLFPLWQLGGEHEDQDDDDDDLQQQQLIPTPMETVASQRAGPLWNCVEKKSESQLYSLCNIPWCSFINTPHYKII